MAQVNPSLFAAVRGELEADKGDVSLPGKIRIADVAQETPALPDRAIDFVLGGDDVVAAVLQEEAAAAEREDWEAVASAHQKMAELGAYDAEARAGKLLHGLGFPAETHDRPVSAFSGTRKSSSFQTSFQSPKAWNRRPSATAHRPEYFFR